jgi:hypothetical protein
MQRGEQFRVRLCLKHRDSAGQTKAGGPFCAQLYLPSVLDTGSMIRHCTPSLPST